MQSIKRLPIKTPSAAETLSEFLLTKRAEGKAERTIKDYAYHVGRFFASYPDAWPHELKSAIQRKTSMPFVKKLRQYRSSSSQENGLTVRSKRLASLKTILAQERDKLFHR